MPSLKDIRKRIASVKNTQKITKAMKLVSAAKLRKAQDAIMAARPYAEKIDEVMHSLAGRVEASEHPLLAEREVRKVHLVVITSDRGLCGGFNGNINRSVIEFLRKNDGKYEEISLRFIGRKAREYFKRRDVARAGKDYSPYDPAVFGELPEELTRTYSEGGFDEVYLVHNRFHSVVSQVVTFQKLLPLSAPETEEEGARTDYLYEPEKGKLLSLLLPRYVQSQVHRSILESVAGEHGARMTAMDSATNNAGDMIQKLTLTYNRARQAVITKELMEIVGGAEALKG